MPYLRIPLAYLALGVIWIVVTDAVVEHVAPSFSAMTAFQTAKGWFYVVLSSVLLFVLMRRSHRKQLQQEAERDALFRKTVQGAHHILRNYLNQMQLVTLEAERCAGFDQTTLTIAHDASEQAASALSQLENLRSPTPSSVHDVLYSKLDDKRSPG